METNIRYNSPVKILDEHLDLKILSRRTVQTGAFQLLRTFLPPFKWRTKLVFGR